MPIHTTIPLHEEDVLWGSRITRDAVMDLKTTTLPNVWETTYQGNLNASMSDRIFDVDEWFTHRFSIIRPTNAIARWLSIDTALSDTEASALSAIVVGELMPDYRLYITNFWSAKVQFPYLINKIIELAREYNYEDKLRGIIIENKSSGVSAIQTLQASAEPWLVEIIAPFTPTISKEMRWGESAIWCKLDCVRLPKPSGDTLWLYEFENDLRNAPDVIYKDRLDAFAQLVIYLENLIGEGYRARTR